MTFWRDPNKVLAAVYVSVDICTSNNFYEFMELVFVDAQSTVAFLKDHRDISAFMEVSCAFCDCS